MADLAHLNGECPHCHSIGRIGMAHTCVPLGSKRVKLIRMMGVVVACILTSGESDG